MSKILFIALENIIRQGSPQAAVTPPLGMACLAAFARQERPEKDSFILVDEGIDPKTPMQWSEILARTQPDIIAVSALTLQADLLKKRIGILKECAPQTPVVVGGPHATAMGTTLLQTPGIDYIVRGEGELGFVGLLNTLEKGDAHPKHPIPGLAFINPDGLITQYPHNKMLLDVNSLPLPAWDIISFDDYAKARRMTPTEIGGNYAPITTSRGCPFHCIYCHDIFGSKFRAMSPKRVIEHMEYLIFNQKINDFEIVDDIFNLDYERAMEVCRLIIEKGHKIRFSFPNGLRCDLLDRPLIRALRQAGAYHIAFAVETADKDLQKKIRKNLNIEKVRQNIAIAAQEGIFTWGFFMLGFPGETRRQMKKTLKFATESKLHGAFFFAVTPFPDTPLARQCLSETQALEISSGVSYFFGKNDLSALSSKQLSRLQAWAFARFFLSPFRIIRIWCDYPSSRISLIKKAYYFFSHIFLTRFRQFIFRR